MKSITIINIVADAFIARMTMASTVVITMVLLLLWSLCLLLFAGLLATIYGSNNSCVKGSHSNSNE